MFSRAKKQKVDLPDTVEEAQTGGEGYQKEFGAASIRERRLVFSLRAMALCLFLAISLNLVQGFLLVSLFPLKEVRPFLVQVAQEGSIVAAIKPIQDTYDAKDLLTERLVREYVVVRSEVLRSDEVMKYRWNPSGGYMGATTDGDELKRFIEQNTEVIKQIRAEGGEIRAEILSVNPISAGRVYVVDFRLKTFDANGRQISDDVYTATLDVEYRPMTGLTHDEMLMNPTGFTVTNYTISKKAESARP